VIGVSSDIPTVVDTDMTAARVLHATDEADRGWLIRELDEACEAVESGRSATGLVIAVTGALADGAQPPARRSASVHDIARWEKAVRRLERLDAPSAICLDGHCRHAGLELALACDLRIATPEARISVPTVSEGGLPGMALFRLGRSVGFPLARRLGLLGIELDAATALAAGLVDRIVPGDAVAEAEAALLSLGPDPQGLAIRRRLISDSATQSFEDALGAHLAACDRTLRTLRRTDR
jgi:isomerase DpgB